MVVLRVGQGRQGQRQHFIPLQPVLQGQRVQLIEGFKREGCAQSAPLRPAAAGQQPSVLGSRSVPCSDLAGALRPIVPLLPHRLCAHSADSCRLAAVRRRLQMSAISSACSR